MIEIHNLLQKDSWKPIWIIHFIVQLVCTGLYFTLVPFWSRFPNLRVYIFYGIIYAVKITKISFKCQVKSVTPRFLKISLVATTAVWKVSQWEKMFSKKWGVTLFTWHLKNTLVLNLFLLPKDPSVLFKFQSTIIYCWATFWMISKLAVRVKMPHSLSFSFCMDNLY